MFRTFTRVVAIASLLALMVPVGCSKSSKTKGGGEKGPAAQTANQKVGGTAKGDQTKADDKGAEYEAVTCDASDEGLGWCDSETEIVFCSGEHFWVLDCSAIG